jgi:hypothetical protein
MVDTRFGLVVFVLPRRKFFDVRGGKLSKHIGRYQKAAGEIRLKRHPAVVALNAISDKDLSDRLNALEISEI